MDQILPEHPPQTPQNTNFFKKIPFSMIAGSLGLSTRSSKILFVLIIIFVLLVSFFAYLLVPPRQFPSNETITVEKGSPLGSVALSFEEKNIADDAVAGSKAGDAGPQAFDFTGEFGGGREREGRLMLVLARNDKRVEEIQRRGFDADHRLARSGGGFGDIGKRELVRRAVVGAEQGFHGAVNRSMAFLAASGPMPPSHCRFSPVLG